jgi:hypothetical protein
VAEGIFYDDESGAPEKSADDEGEVGFEGRGFFVGGRGVDKGSTLGARLRVVGRLAGDE